jgi:hypothetical protein
MWNATATGEKVYPGFIKQIQSRIHDVLTVHPEFTKPTVSIGNTSFANYSDLLAKLEFLDDELYSPFTVLIHGDFNCDNVLYNRNQKRIHFIDLNRSSMQDYTQDAAVFLISLYRMPFFKIGIREKLNHAMREFLNFSSDYARSRNDHTFDARLSLGVARAFLTSTRFLLNNEFAGDLYMRSIYLLEKLMIHHNKKLSTGDDGQISRFSDFKFPEKILEY